MKNFTISWSINRLHLHVLWFRCCQTFNLRQNSRSQTNSESCGLLLSHPTSGVLESKFDIFATAHREFLRYFPACLRPRTWLYTYERRFYETLLHSDDDSSSKIGSKEFASIDFRQRSKRVFCTCEAKTRDSLRRKHFQCRTRLLGNHAIR